MKNSLFMLVLLCSVSAFGQKSDTLMVWRYADLSYALGGFTTKAKVSVDFGESSGWFKPADMLEDKEGKAIKFNSPVDALNWMSALGWELVQSYPVKLESLGTTDMHYIMRRLEPRKRG